MLPLVLLQETAPSSQFFERVEGEVLSLNKKERKQERTVSQSEVCLV